MVVGSKCLDLSGCSAALRTEADKRAAGLTGSTGRAIRLTSVSVLIGPEERPDTYRLEVIIVSLS